MSSDDRKPTQAPTTDDIADAYRAYRASHAAFLRTLRRHARVVPPQADGLFIAALDGMPIVRILHAMAHGRLSRVILCPECSARFEEALFLGLIVERAEDGSHTVTDQGAEMLRRWIDHVAPLRNHHARYAELWDAMTGLES
jgi:hypothetical protein